MTNNSALIIVDVQKDFISGSLAVPDAESIIEPILKIKNKFTKVFFTQDHHPKDHCSFKINGGLWPEHCVQNTLGALIDYRLISTTKVSFVIEKGTDKDVDSYSGFFDNNKEKATILKSRLDFWNITDVYICGLATDYCVKYTALDAVELGYKTNVIIDCCRGVITDTTKDAIEEMKLKGVKIINSYDIK
jgi:nicotinamidase/pyrazinamidase